MIEQMPSRSSGKNVRLHPVATHPPAEGEKLNIEKADKYSLSA